MKVIEIIPVTELWILFSEFMMKLNADGVGIEDPLAQRLLLPGFSLRRRGMVDRFCIFCVTQILVLDQLLIPNPVKVRWITKPGELNVVTTIGSFRTHMQRLVQVANNVNEQSQIHDLLIL